MAGQKPKFGSIYQRGKTFWIKYSAKGQIFRESSHSKDAADAERLLKRRVGEVAFGKFSGLAHERVTLNELFDDLVTDYKVNRRKTLSHLLSRLRLHLRPAFGKVRANVLSTAQLKRYMAARLEAEAAPATVNRELEFVERALRLGAQCEPPKVMKAIRVPSLKENNVRVGFLDDAGYLKLRDELPGYLKAIFVTGYHVGPRVGELLGLRWEQVDFSNWQIVLNPGTTKNGKGRTLPIYGEMKEWLLAQQAERDAKYPTCRFVFAHDGHRITEFRKAWASACKRAEVEGLLFHDLRRSAVRNMRMAGIPENVAMQITGHKTRSIFDRYSIVGGQEIKDAAAKMEKRFRSSLGTILGTVDPTEPKEDDGDKTDDGGKPLKE
ncbi:MAG: site-specific integrase [Candidatus Solibacter sp.]|jgi:integrase